MQAAINTNYGAPNVLSVTEAPRPSVGPEDVLVEVHASAVTEGDRRLRAADYPGMGAVFGRLMTGLFRPRNAVAGTMFAGRVVAVGEAVTRFREGDDVFGSCMRGAYAEYLVVPAGSALAQMPPNVDYAEACAIPYGAVTALVFLRDLAEVEAGDKVLIVGASGGVGRMAVQFAHHLGAEVTGVCSRDHDLVEALGADHVIDYTERDFTKNGKRYDVIFDTHEDNRFRESRGSLTPRGRYLSLYMSMRLLIQMGLTAMTRGPRAICGVALGNRRHMEDVADLVATGALRPVIARRFPLTDIAEAHAFLEGGRTRGSVVVNVAAPRRKTAPAPHSAAVVRPLPLGAAA